MSLSRYSLVTLFIATVLFPFFAYAETAFQACPPGYGHSIIASSKRLIYQKHNLNFVFKHHSLKKMLAQISTKSGWKLVWKLPNDYYLHGIIKVRVRNVAQAMLLLLKDQPLKAIFYDKSRVVVITSKA